MLKQISRRQVDAGEVSAELQKALEDSAPTAEAAQLMQRILSLRGIADEKALDFSTRHLLPFTDLKNSHEAAELLATAILQKWSILILGDYDADGATAATIALLALREMGANSVDYLVPNRFDYGYGLSPEIAEVAIARAPQLVITVDNGISSIEGVARLRDAGIEVLITDHHLPASQLPNASVIVNPSQPGCQFASKSLAGVGVMFYVLLSLRDYLQKQSWYTKEAANLAQYLDLVALGTVADVVPLDRNNQILVAQGIARIRAGKCRLGVRALLEVAGRALPSIVSQDLGYVVAPRLNAAGRLDDISIGIECLLCHDYAKAQHYAQLLEDTNAQRKSIEKQMQTQAMQYVRQLEQRGELGAENAICGICLYQDDWHQGVTGLIASRIKEQYGQPCIVFAPTSSGELTGSARSISGLHIKDLLEKIAQEHPTLMRKFGGHAMAAGLTLEAQNLPKFTQIFKQTVAQFCAHMYAGHVLYSDGEVPAQAMSLQTAQYLRHAYPWGQTVEAPLFDATFNVLSQKIVGQLHVKMQLQCQQSGQCYDAIAFRAIDEGQTLATLNKIQAAFRLDVNEFRGQRNLQLIIEYFKPLDG